MNVILSSNISSQYIQIFTNRLNNTAIEIILQLFNYIGAFHLICLSTRRIDIGTCSDIIIGKSPGLFMCVDRCVVYYDEYIDCAIRAPIMLQAMNNRLTYKFLFIERRLYLQPRVYQEQPELVKIDNINETLTFRWFPKVAGYFPSGIKMVIYGTIVHFGTTNYTTNMTLKPGLAVIDSTSTTNFNCTNYESNEKPLKVNLSKIISSNEIKITTNILNKNTINIRLEAKNYVGIFHLLCYVNGEQTKGTRADVIVKAAPGVLQLIERCRVYDKQYIKCRIRAPTIARAIQNDYPAKFEFNEISHSHDNLAYITRFEFLKNESTNEYLTFKWRPTADGEFPDKVRMHMKAILPHFNVSSYNFDMTPIFRITPKFTLQAISSSEIQIKLASISPAAFCDKSIIPKLGSNINRTWTIVEANRNTIIIDKLLSDSVYRVCMKCRQTYTDPDGMEECQEIKTLSKFNFLYNQNYFIFIIIIVILILFIILGIGFYCWKYQQSLKYQQVANGKIFKITSLNGYDGSVRHETISSGSINTSSPYSAQSSTLNDMDVDNDCLIENNNDEYLPLASITEVIEMSSPPKILPRNEN
ncbi:unnamed protein product [Rotaria sp. Silwood1]|nr:unnamed protein product [Rotaria sp. Silwood1]